ncbi:hypothetical protein WA158_007108 [Blastocystis sp. Blastoise]
MDQMFQAIYNFQNSSNEVLPLLEKNSEEDKQENMSKYEQSAVHVLESKVYTLEMQNIGLKKENSEYKKQISELTADNQKISKTIHDILIDDSKESQIELELLRNRSFDTIDKDNEIKEKLNNYECVSSYLSMFIDKYKVLYTDKKNLERIMNKTLEENKKVNDQYNEIKSKYDEIIGKQKDEENQATLLNKEYSIQIESLKKELDLSVEKEKQYTNSVDLIGQTLSQIEIDLKVKEQECLDINKQFNELKIDHDHLKNDYQALLDKENSKPVFVPTHPLDIEEPKEEKKIDNNDTVEKKEYDLLQQRYIELEKNYSNLKLTYESEHGSAMKLSSLYIPIQEGITLYKRNILELKNSIEQHRNETDKYIQEYKSLVNNDIQVISDDNTKCLNVLRTEIEGYKQDINNNKKTIEQLYTEKEVLSLELSHEKELHQNILKDKDNRDLQHEYNLLLEKYHMLLFVIEKRMINNSSISNNNDNNNKDGILISYEENQQYIECKHENIQLKEEKSQLLLNISELKNTILSLEMTINKNKTLSSNDSLYMTKYIEKEKELEEYKKLYIEKESQYGLLSISNEGLKQKFEKEKQIYIDECNKLREENDINLVEKKNKENELEMNKEEHEKLVQSIKEKEDTIKTLNDTISSLITEKVDLIDKHMKEIKEKENYIIELNDQSEQKEKKISSMNQYITSINSELDSYKLHSSTLSKQIELEDTKQKERESLLHSTNSYIEELKENLEHSWNEKKIIRGYLKELNNEKQELQEKYQTLEKRNTELECEHDTLIKKINDLQLYMDNLYENQDFGQKIQRYFVQHKPSWQLNTEKVDVPDVSTVQLILDTFIDELEITQQEKLLFKQWITHYLTPALPTDSITNTIVINSLKYDFMYTLCYMIVPYLREHVYTGYTIDIYTKQYINVQGDIKLVFRKE